MAFGDASSVTQDRGEGVDERPVAAQRASRLLLAADDDSLEAFRKVHLRSAPHRTIDELRLLRSTLEVLVGHLTSDDAVDFSRIERAARVLGVDTRPQRFEIVDEDTLDVLPAPCAGAEPPASSAPPSGFPQSFGADQAPPVSPAQFRTGPVSPELLRRASMVDRVLGWTVDQWANLCFELDVNPRAVQTVWLRHGVTGGPAVYDAVRKTWERRMLDPDMRRRFEACLAFRRANLQ
jgi:hypothetical protein